MTEETRAPHSPDPQTEEPDDDTKMSVWDHMEELRTRLLRSIIALVLAFFVALFFTWDIIEYLSAPYDDKLQQLEPTGNVVLYFRVALMTAGIITIPYLTYQVMMFVLPGLTKEEKRKVYYALPFTTAFFMLGVSFAWFIMVPAAFAFLQEFGGNVFENQWTAQRYFSFLTSVIFWIGVSFEMPVVLYVLGRMGLIGRRVLIEQWRLAVVVIAIIAALITPTVDPFNMLLVMAPLLMLYAISILLVSIAERQIKRATSSQS